MMDMQTQMRLTGLASGLDTDAIIQNLGKVHTIRIDTVKRERQLAVWRQESYRNTITMLQNFAKSSFNTANPTSNFRSASAFAKFNYNLSIGGAVSDAAKTAASKVLSVTANGDLKNFNQSVQAVAQLASKDTWTGKDMGLRGIKSNGFNIENFVTRNPNGSSSVTTPYFGLSIDGVSRTIQIDAAKINAIVNGTAGGQSNQYNKLGPSDGYSYKAATDILGAGLPFDISDPSHVNKLQSFAIEDAGGNKLSALGVVREIQGYLLQADPTADISDYISVDNDTGEINFIQDLPPAAIDALRNSSSLPSDIIDKIENKESIQLIEPDYSGLDLETTYVASGNGLVSMNQYLATQFGVTAEQFNTIVSDLGGVLDPDALVGALNSASGGAFTASNVRSILNNAGTVQRYEKNAAYDANAAADAFAKLVNDEVVKQFGKDYSGIVTADASGELVFNKTGSSITLFDSFGAGTQLAPLGFPSGGVSSNSLNSKTISDLFGESFFQERDQNNNMISTSRTIQINGKSIVLDPKDTLSAMISKINNYVDPVDRSGTGVTISYSSSSGKFTLTSKQEGSANNISDVTGAAAQFFGFLGLGETVETEREIMTMTGNTAWVKDFKLVVGGELELADNERIVEKDANGNKIGTIGKNAGGQFVRFGLDDQEVNDGVVFDIDELKTIAGVTSVGDRAKGNNLIAQINGEIFVRQSNSFQYEGMTYTFNSTFNVKNDGSDTYTVGANDKISINYVDPADRQEDIKINVGKNTTEIIDSIKAFVEEYNTIIDHLNDLLNGKRDREYKPLTDDEKKAMKDEDIKAYEDRARKGIMANDTDLRKLLNEMRSAIYQKVDGVGLTMSDIGIATSANWKEGGRLSISEDKLRAAIENRYDEVVSLFTKPNTSEYKPLTDDQKKAMKAEDIKAYEEMARKGIMANTGGIAQRLNKVLDEASRTTTFDVSGNSMDKKGYLVEKAGVVNDRSQFDNTIQKQLTTYDDKINTLLERWYRQENAYYAMFARMETAMAKMNSQQNSLASLMAQMGGGK